MSTARGGAKTRMSVAYKILHGQEESKLFMPADRPGAARMRQTAGTKTLVPKFARTEPRKFYFTVRSVDKWNRLPQTLRQEATLDGFKRNLKQMR
jgi:hypothetical protein